MSRTPEHRIFIRSIRKDPPDYVKLGQALLRLATMKAAAEAEAPTNNEAADIPPPVRVEPERSGQESES